MEGKVFARVLVGRKGRVEHIDRIEVPQVFHRAVAQAAKAWEFSPAVQKRPRRSGVGQLAVFCV